MLIKYEEFLDLIKGKILSGDDLYDQILKNLIKSPERYTGLFRLSNPKNKMIQSLTHSIEIKLGDILEELIERYFSRLGFEVLQKRISVGNKNYLVDQLITKNNNIYLIEQKIRDDHDSTKIDGQFNNFVNKTKAVKAKYETFDVFSIMWFIDDTFNKNRNYYISRLSKMESERFELLYGGELFEYFNHGQIWDEIVEHLNIYRQELDPEVINIPDFGKSDVMLDALMRLSSNNWNKLTSAKPIYQQLREELFSNGDNLIKAAKMRG